MSDLIHIHDTMLSDMYKDAHGFRPRGHYKEWWTESELEEEYNWLQKLINESMERDRIRHELAEKEFEALIEKTISLGAKDRDTAIRWLMDAEDVDTSWPQDVEHFFWNMGLSYEKYVEYGKKYSK